LNLSTSSLVPLIFLATLAANTPKAIPAAAPNNTGPTATVEPIAILVPAKYATVDPKLKPVIAPPSPKAAPSLNSAVASPSFSFLA